MRYIFSFLILSVVLGCSKSPKPKTTNSHDYIDKVSLQPIDTLVIPIDAKTKYQSQFIQLFTIDNKEKIAVENKKKLSIQIYDLESRSLEKEIFFQNNGPNGIGKLFGFNFINMDSIILLTGQYFKVYLSDSTGAIKNTFHLDELLPSLESVPITYTKRPTFFDPKRAKLFICASPENRYDKRGYFDAEIAMELDMKNNTAEYIYKSPTEYRDNIYGAYFSHYSVVKKPDGKYVYAFPFDSEIFETDLKEYYHKYYAGSRHFDQIPEMKPDDSYEEFYIKSDSYKDFIYDQWRRVYYRVATQAINLVDENAIRKTWRDKVPSIIILDENLEKIGEVDFPKERYYFGNNMFVGKNGLYISNNNDNNPIANEDYFEFKKSKEDSLRLNEYLYSLGVDAIHTKKHTFIITKVDYGCHSCSNDVLRYLKKQHKNPSMSFIVSAMGDKSISMYLETFDSEFIIKDNKDLAKKMSVIPNTAVAYYCEGDFVTRVDEINSGNIDEVFGRINLFLNN